ncbi:MAG: aldehyde dehydrogenase family protein [Bdellovibrionota bacterium]
MSESVLQQKITFKGSFIKGRWIKHEKPSGSFGVQSPANLAWKLPEVGFHYDDIEEATAIGRAAFKEWKLVPVENRIQALTRFGVEIEKRSELLARLIAFEIGKPLKEAKGEVAALVNKIKVTCDAGLSYVKTQRVSMPNGHGEIHYRPKGLMLVIGPFNFPVHLSHGHIVPALLMGNSVILKPSEKAPYSAQVYMEAFEASDFPPGVLQMLHGNPEMSTRLVRHPEIDGVIATCSFEVGAKIQNALASNPEKIVALEMGGKNAAIIWEAGEGGIEKIANDLITSCFLTTGQRCTALSRTYVKRDLLDAVLSCFHDKAKKLIIGNPFDENPDPFMGPIVTAQAMEKFLRYDTLAANENAEVIMRPKRLEKIGRASEKPLPEGYYVAPSIHLVSKWNAESSYQNHEIFGPDMFFCPIDSLDEGIEATNANQYGLSFSLFSPKLEDFNYVADRVDVGLAYWNKPTVGASALLPFGGWKRSGNHRPAGIFAIYACTQAQARIL